MGEAEAQGTRTFCRVLQKAGHLAHVQLDTESMARNMGGLYSGRTALQDDSSVATLTCSIFSPRRVDPVPHDAPKPPGYTRFVCVSDTHSRTDPIQMPYGDVLIHAGDFTELGLPSEVKKFNEWLGRSCMLSALGACEGVTSRAALS